MEIKLEIPADRIAQLMCSAIEGGDPVTTARKGGWCEGIYLRGWWEKHMKDLDEVWYADPKLYSSNEFTIEIVEVDDETTGHLTKHRRNAAEFAKGLAVMAKKFPRQFGQIMTDDIDAPCADAFLQSLLFGDEKYA